MNTLGRILECTICLGELREPKRLPCQHHFCKCCLLQLAKSSVGRLIKCPECREETNSIMDIAQLPSDFRLNALLEFRKKEPSLCNQCLNQTLVLKNCTHCSMKLCSSCYKEHIKLSILEHFAVMDRNLQEDITNLSKFKAKLMKKVKDNIEAARHETLMLVNEFYDDKMDEWRGRMYEYEEEEGTDECRKLNIQEIQQTRERVYDTLMAAESDTNEHCLLESLEKCSRISETFSNLEVHMDELKQTLLEMVNINKRHVMSNGRILIQEKKLFQEEDKDMIYQLQYDEKGTLMKLQPWPVIQHYDADDEDGMGSIIAVTTKLQCISSLEEYNTKCLEELRWEDYRIAYKKEPKTKQIGTKKINAFVFPWNQDIERKYLLHTKKGLFQVPVLKFEEDKIEIQPLDLHPQCSSEHNASTDNKATAFEGFVLPLPESSDLHPIKSYKKKNLRRKRILRGPHIPSEPEGNNSQRVKSPWKVSQVESPRTTSIHLQEYRNLWCSATFETNMDIDKAFQSNRDVVDFVNEVLEEIFPKSTVERHSTNVNDAENMQHIASILHGLSTFGSGILISTADDRDYALNLLASKITRLSEDMEYSEDYSHTFRSVLQLTNAVPRLLPLILAHIYQECPYILPVDIHQVKMNENENYKASLGFKFDNHGMMERHEQFLNRVRHYMRFYANLLVAETLKPFPDGVSIAWGWLVEIIHIPPFQNITVTILHEMLKVTSPKLKIVYGKQFKKLLRVIRNKFIPKVYANTEHGRMAHVATLELWIDDALQIMSKVAVDKCRWKGGHSNSYSLPHEFDVSDAEDTTNSSSDDVEMCTNYTGRINSAAGKYSLTKDACHNRACETSSTRKDYYSQTRFESNKPSTSPSFLQYLPTLRSSVTYVTQCLIGRRKSSSRIHLSYIYPDE